MVLPSTAYRHGGRFYWLLRNGWMGLRHGVNRSGRLVEKNWNLSLLAWGGCPKFSYDPKVNQWVWMVDGGEWQGVGGRMLGDFAYHIVLYGLIGMWSYYLYYRLLVNSKLDFLYKKNSE